jgi:hypothetical protein
MPMKLVADVTYYRMLRRMKSVEVEFTASGYERKRLHREAWEEFLKEARAIRGVCKMFYVDSEDFVFNC